MVGIFLDRVSADTNVNALAFCIATVIALNNLKTMPKSVIDFLNGLVDSGIELTVISSVSKSVHLFLRHFAVCLSTDELCLTCFCVVPYLRERAWLSLFAAQVVECIIDNRVS